MPADRSQFRVDIKTTADLAAMEATIARLQGQIEATRMLGKDTASLEGNLRKAQQTKIESALADITGKTQEAGEGFKKAGESTEEFLEGRHGIHAIGHALNQALPGLMQFTRFLTSGFTAAIGVALLAFELIKSKIEEFDKMLDELNSGPGARGEWAEKLEENTRNAAVELATFNEHLIETAARQDTLAASTDRLITAQKRQTENAKSLADAQKELDLARVALMEKLGDVTPEQAIKMKIEIDDAAFKRQLASEKAAIEAELNARKGQLDTNDNNERILRENVERTSAGATAAQSSSDKNTAKLEQDKKNLEDLKDKIATAEKVIADFGAGDAFSKGVTELPAYKEAEGQLKQLYDLQASYQRSKRQEQEQQTALATAAAIAKQQARAAESDYDEAAKASHEILMTVQKLKADLAATTAKDAALQAIHDQRSQVQSQTENADRTNAARQVLLRRALEPDHGRAEERLEDTQSNRLHEQAAKAMNDANDAARHPGFGGLQPNLRSMVDLVQQLTDFIKNHPAMLPGSHDDMQAEIDTLKRDVADMAMRAQVNRGY